jgi:trk system potassium uptake protein
MKVVITGAGKIGRHLAGDLSERGHEVTLIEQEKAAAARAAHDLPEAVTILLGDACEPYVLEEAKLMQADVVVAATGDDEDNLVTSLLAKQEFAVPRVLARVNHSRNEWMFTEQWGVDVPVSPPHILTALVEEAVTVGDVVRLLKLERGKVTTIRRWPDARCTSFDSPSIRPSWPSFVRSTWSSRSPRRFSPRATN